MVDGGEAVTTCSLSSKTALSSIGRGRNKRPFTLAWELCKRVALLGWHGSYVKGWPFYVGMGVM